MACKEADYASMRLKLKLGILARSGETACKKRILFASQLVTELLRIEFVIVATLVQQFCVAAAFGDFAVFNYDDSIGASNRRKAMGDDETGASLHHRFHALLDQRLGQSIDRTGSFVHHENFRVGENGARQTDQLLLAYRQKVTTLPFFCFCIGGVQAAEANIFQHAARKQVRSLQDNADARLNSLQSKFFVIGA